MATECVLEGNASEECKKRCRLLKIKNRFFNLSNEQCINRHLTVGAIVAFGCTVIGGVLLYIGYEKFAPFSAKEDWDQFGSFLQGAVGSFWTLGGTALIYITFLAQKLQIEQNRKDLEDQRKQLLIQNFESSFFNLLNNHHGIVDALEHGNYKRRQCFPRWTQSLVYEYEDIVANRPTKEPALKAFESMFDDKQENLAHYFRNLYHVVKYVHESELEDVKKRKYVSIVRAQLSAFELALLFLNGLSIYGEKFKKLIEEYALFDNLNPKLKFGDHLAMPYFESMKRRYDHSAYGNNKFVDYDFIEPATPTRNPIS